ncbi:hypothetical protein MEO93_30070, partial [Dolichospermum sp. ST_sed3]|nr:hypothetical protein [Dolichospermum sp. ST_sed3]
MTYLTYLKIDMKRSVLILLVGCTAFIGAIIGSIFTIQFINSDPVYTSIEERQNLKLTNYRMDTAARVSSGLNFQTAARLVTPAVVHIRIAYGGGKFSLNAIDSYLNPHAQSSG